MAPAADLQSRPSLMLSAAAAARVVAAVMHSNRQASADCWRAKVSSLGDRHVAGSAGGQMLLLLLLFTHLVGGASF